MKKLLFAVVFSIIVLSLAGCGNSIKTDDGKMKISDKGMQFEDSQGNKTTVSNDGDGNMQFEGTNGSLSVGTNVKLPDGYPEDILPLYKENNITYSAKTDDGYAVMYTTKESLDDVKKFYSDVFKDSENKSSFDSGTGTMIGGSLDKYDLVASIAGDKEGVTVTLTVTNKQ